MQSASRGSMLVLRSAAGCSIFLALFSPPRRWLQGAFHDTLFVHERHLVIVTPPSFESVAGNTCRGKDMPELTTHTNISITCCIQRVQAPQCSLLH